MLTTGDSTGVESLRKNSGAVQDRLALTRMLIWAEQEAESMGADSAAGRIREAISALHRDG